MNGSIPCSSAFFGDDPRMGLPKLCSCMSGPAWPTAVVDGLNETIARKLLVRVEAGPADAGCSAEDDGKWTPCSVMSSRFDASLIPDRIVPRLPIEEQRDVALRKLDLCHNLAGPDQALRILGVWPSSIPLGVLPIKASSAPLCAVVFSPTAGAQWGSRGTIYCPTDPPKCLEGSCECAESSQSRVDIRHSGGAKASKEDTDPPCWACLPPGTSLEDAGPAQGQRGGSTASGRMSWGLPAGARTQDVLAFCRGRRLEGRSGGRAASGVCAKQRCPEMIPEMQGLFDATFRKIYTRDRRGAPIADRFHVQQVYRVLNDQVWREYESHREKIRLLRWNCDALDRQIPGGPATHAFCESLRRLGRSRLPLLDSQVGECWLFHGTSFEAAEPLMQDRVARLPPR